MNKAWFAKQGANAAGLAVRYPKYLPYPATKFTYTDNGEGEDATTGKVLLETPSWVKLKHRKVFWQQFTEENKRYSDKNGVLGNKQGSTLAKAGAISGGAAHGSPAEVERR